MSLQAIQQLRDLIAQLTQRVAALEADAVRRRDAADAVAWIGPSLQKAIKEDKRTKKAP